MHAMVLNAPGAALGFEVDTGTYTSVFPLCEANALLSKLRAGQITGAAVLLP